MGGNGPGEPTAIKTRALDDFSNFANTVINKKSFEKLAKVIDKAKASSDAEIPFCGNYGKRVSYFIKPTVIKPKRPDYISMKEELLGPILTVYVYKPDKQDETKDILNSTTDYALTGFTINLPRWFHCNASRRPSCRKQAACIPTSRRKGNVRLPEGAGVIAACIPSRRSNEWKVESSYGFP